MQQRREDLHKAIRAGDMEEMMSILRGPEGSKLAKAKNYYGKWKTISYKCWFLIQTFYFTPL